MDLSHIDTSERRPLFPHPEKLLVKFGVALLCMALSARNQLAGKVTEIQLGEVMAHVVVRVGKNLVESVITRRSAEELRLKKGDSVTVVIKSTEVMLQKG